MAIVFFNCGYLFSVIIMVIVVLYRVMVMIIGIEIFGNNGNCNVMELFEK